VNVIFDNVTKFVGQMTILVIGNCRTTLKKTHFKLSILLFSWMNRVLKTTFNPITRERQKWCLKEEQTVTQIGHNRMRTQREETNKRTNEHSGNGNRIRSIYRNQGGRIGPKSEPFRNRSWNRLWHRMIGVMVIQRWWSGIPTPVRRTTMLAQEMVERAHAAARQDRPSTHARLSCGRGQRGQTVHGKRLLLPVCKSRRIRKVLAAAEIVSGRTVGLKIDVGGRFGRGQISSRSCCWGWTWHGIESDIARPSVQVGRRRGAGVAGHVRIWRRHSCRVCVRVVLRRAASRVCAVNVFSRRSVEIVAQRAVTNWRVIVVVVVVAIAAVVCTDVVGRCVIWRGLWRNDLLLAGVLGDEVVHFFSSLNFFFFRVFRDLVVVRSQSSESRNSVTSLKRPMMAKKHGIQLSFSTFCIKCVNIGYPNYKTPFFSQRRNLYFLPLSI